MRLKCGSNLQTEAPEAFQHLCAQPVPTSCRSLSRWKVSITKGYSHWIGPLFKKLFGASIASCLLNKNPQTQSTTEFQPDSSISQRNDTSFDQREWNTCFQEWFESISNKLNLGYKCFLVSEWLLPFWRAKCTKDSSTLWLGSQIITIMFSQCKWAWLTMG